MITDGDIHIMDMDMDIIGATTHIGILIMAVTMGMAVIMVMGMAVIMAVIMIIATMEEAYPIIQVAEVV